MTEPGQSQATPHASRFRFSLRALFLFVLVIGLAFSHVITSNRLSDATWQLRLVNDENRKLHQVLGYLNVEDPDRLYVAASPQFLLEDLKWRWQVYVPRTGFRLHAVVVSIPCEGMPGKQVKKRSLPLPRGEFTLDAAVRKNHSGQWELNVNVAADPTSSTGMSVVIPETYSRWLSTHQNGGGMRFECGSVEQGEPLVLVRYRRLKEISDLETGDDLEPCEGVMIWIDDE